MITLGFVKMATIIVRIAVMPVIFDVTLYYLWDLSKFGLGRCCQILSLPTKLGGEADLNLRPVLGQLAKSRLILHAITARPLKKKGLKRCR